jgi:hypothetical protein
VMSSAQRDVRRSVSGLMLASVSSSSVGRRNARGGGAAVNTHMVEIAGCNYQSLQPAEGFDLQAVGGYMSSRSASRFKVQPLFFRSLS